MEEEQTFRGLSQADVESLTRGYEDDGAVVHVLPEDGGTLALIVTYPDGWTPNGTLGTPPAPPAEPPADPNVRAPAPAPAPPPAPGPRGPGGEIAITLLPDEERDCLARSPQSPDKFYYGTRVSYRDDMARVGLYQDRKIHLIDDAGIYDPGHWAAAGHGAWAHFIWPTAMAESGGRFARLNSYDRAAFTFGFFQFAAHTPNENLIILFRKLLALSDASRIFPDLALRRNASGNETVHRVRSDGSVQDLEVARLVTRPNGKREEQIPDFMAYLNADPASVDNAERLVSARLLLWSKLDLGMRKAQVENAVETVRRRMSRLKAKVPQVAADWRFALWGSDIMHQGRGSINSIRSAVASGNPLQALHAIGAGGYRSRVDLVQDCIRKLENSGVMQGFAV